MNLKTTSPESLLLTADWVAPMNAPLFRNGAILIAGGKIQKIAHRGELKGDSEIDFADSVLMPGLVNAHTHLELSDCACVAALGKGFADWLAGMLLRTRLTPDEMNAKVEQAVPIGVEQCLRFGVTTTGDISRQCRLTRRLLHGGRLRVVSFGEIQAMAQRRGLLEERLEIAADETESGPRLHIGITPHAPYSVEPQGYRHCLEVARQKNLPLATHLAESAEEAPFLAEHKGALRKLWDSWLTWDDAVPKFTGGPIRYAHDLGLLDYPTVLAHVNFCDDEEMAILAAGKASVVYCPRTHRNFGHPRHRWRDMLARGINVAIGTDSCASSPDLNLVDDLRLLHRLRPEVPASELWQLATLNGARALGVESVAGSLAEGMPADIVAFQAATDDPLRAILESDALPSAVLIEGQPAK